MHKESSRDLYDRFVISDPLDLYRKRCQQIMESARASHDPMVNNVGTLAWMIKLCVQGDSLTSHLNNCPCTNPSEPTTTSASGEMGNSPAPLPRPHQGAEAGGLIGGQLEARTAEYKCQECGLHFAGVAGLKLHQKRVHQMPTLPPAKGDFREHSIDGMPV